LRKSKEYQEECTTDNTHQHGHHAVVNGQGQRIHHADGELHKVVVGKQDECRVGQHQRTVHHAMGRKPSNDALK
jgi:hypothetical protein